MSCFCVTPDVDCCAEDATYRLVVQRRVLAATEYMCSECDHVIKTNERCVHHYCYAYANHGDVGSYTLCDCCQSVADEFFCESFLYGAMWDELGYALEEMAYDEIPTECLSNLTKEAREAVSEMIHDQWDEMEDDDE